MGCYHLLWRVHHKCEIIGSSTTLNEIGVSDLSHSHDNVVSSCTNGWGRLADAIHCLKVICLSAKGLSGDTALPDVCNSSQQTGNLMSTLRLKQLLQAKDNDDKGSTMLAAGDFCHNCYLICVLIFCKYNPLPLPALYNS